MMRQFYTFLALVFSCPLLMAQGDGLTGRDFSMYSAIIVTVALLLWALVSIISNMMKIQGQKYGLDESTHSLGLFPSARDFFKSRKPNYVVGGTYTSLSKGHDIKLAGKAKRNIETAAVTTFGVNPKDFHGLSPIPKIDVEVGQDVKAGDVLFFDKNRPEIKFVAPVSGEVVEIQRGEKRSIENIVILADKEVKYKKFDTPALETATRESLVDFMAQSGLWVLINERPFDVIPELSSIPTNIFVSTFDTAPLAPDNNFIVDLYPEAFQKGLEVLGKLTSGKVHLGLDARGKSAPSDAFTNALGVEKHWFNGPHPAGNVGIQIHHIAPLTLGKKAWTLNVQEVITIGNMFLSQQYMADRIIALTGAEVKNPRYLKTFIGAKINDLVSNDIIGDNTRVISGDVLSGSAKALDSFLSFKDDQITVVKEGDNYELLGWLLPISPRPSVSGTIPSYGKNYKFEAETNTHGEKRAFVVTGQYESVLPMDLYPQFLMKAISTGNVEKMEALGILELTEEDVALCEFVCTSKTPVQQMLREGLTSLKEQL